jgi:putative ABC transport system substrate-binding protein
VPLAEFAAQVRLLAIYAQSQYADAEGLINHGPMYLDLYRRAAQYSDEILKGATPADRSVEQPTKFELVVNMRTAKDLGLSIPDPLLAQATRVIA